MTARTPRSQSIDEIAAAAARLIGTPEQIARRLRTLLDEGAPTAAPRESADARREREAETAAYDRTVAAHRHRLAADFAEARGWRPTTAPMAVKELARRGYPGGTWHRPSREWLGTMFHLAFYRDAGRRAAAMVAHPLAAQVERDQEEIVAWAAERDLTVTFSEEPSWQDPGQAVVVIFEPREPAEDAAPAPHAEPQRGTPTAPPTAPDLGTLQPLELLAPPDVTTDAPGQGEASDSVEEDDMALPAEPHGMRPVAPLDIKGMVPRDLADEEDPHFDIVDPRELLVDEQYQRGLSPRSLALIRRIVENWSWSRFKVPTCVRVDGQLHVVDGQHTAIAAASHPGIQAIPVLVSTMPEVADRAGAFLSHATNRLQATPVQMHRAALTAGAEEAIALESVCRAAGVELLPFPPSGGADYAPGQTVAVVGIRRLIVKRGTERATEILSALSDADLAPISGDHLRLAETLLCDDQYAGGLDAERLTVALRSLTARTHAEARELAIAQRLPAWRALAAVIYRNATKTKPKARQGVDPASTRRRAGA